MRHPGRDIHQLLSIWVLLMPRQAHTGEAVTGLEGVIKAMGG